MFMLNFMPIKVRYLDPSRLIRGTKHCIIYTRGFCGCGYCKDIFCVFSQESELIPTLGTPGREGITHQFLMFILIIDLIGCYIIYINIKRVCCIYNAIRGDGTCMSAPCKPCELCKLPSQVMHL